MLYFTQEIKLTGAASASSAQVIDATKGRKGNRKNYLEKGTFEKWTVEVWIKRNNDS